ncbi:hypothetical protein MRB53_028541 [Persea americana]|uniref:Uncharacterized protein n=1 Tax=Persea americana TaxID=3435 RepID=A0ACC2KGA6_PERAE|nr:hypothetical protein MRB53_028541 [Persea americana]
MGSTSDAMEAIWAWAVAPSGQSALAPAFGSGDGGTAKAYVDGHHAEAILLATEEPADDTGANVEHEAATVEHGAATAEEHGLLQLWNTRPLPLWSNLAYWLTAIGALKVHKANAAAAGIDSAPSILPVFISRTTTTELSAVVCPG